LWVVLVAAIAAPAGGQTLPTWVRPYPQAPEYWELVGRLFGDTSALADDPRFKTITDPAILAIASVTPRAKGGDTVASFAMLTYNGSPENLAELLDPRLVIKDLTQVRVVLAGTLGLMVDVRTGSSSAGHQQCVETRMPQFSYLLDGRWRAVAACEPAVFWSSWQRQPGRLPFTGGTYMVDASTILAVSYDRPRKELSVSLRSPAPAPAPARRSPRRGGAR